MTTATKEKTGLRIDAGELLKAVQDVTRVVHARSPKPILANVRIGDGLVTGTDLEVRIDREIGEQCEPMLLPAGRLLAILRSCRTDDAVTLTPSGASVKVKCGRGSWTLPTEDAVEYPTWDPAGLEPVCRLPADQFCRAIHACEYASNNQSNRYALGAVLIDVQRGENPTFVATDGRRLSAVETSNDQDTDTSQTLVPASAIRMAATLADLCEGSVQIEANRSECVISCDGVTITARLVDGKFPRWRDVFPENSGSSHSVERTELLAATRAAAVVTSDQSRGVDYEFGDTLTLSARSSEYGESKVKCPLDKAGNACKVKLNPAYVTEFLRGLPGDEQPTVDVATHGSGGAVVLTCGEYRGVIMPLSEDA